MCPDLSNMRFAIKTEKYAIKKFGISVDYVLKQIYILLNYLFYSYV